MLDILNYPLRRGDRVIDATGTIYTVRSNSPAVLRLQDARTGKKFNSGKNTFLKVPFGEIIQGTLDTVKARKKFYYDRCIGPRRGPMA